MKMEFSVEGTQGMRANFVAADRISQRTIRRIVRDHGELCKFLTKEFCPVDKGNMQKLVKTRYSPDGLIFETGWLAEDFFARELTFYPPYVEDGTRFRAATPCLRPAYEIVQATFLPDISEAVAAGLERIRSRRGER